MRCTPMWARPQHVVAGVPNEIKKIIPLRKCLQHVFCSVPKGLVRGVDHRGFQFLLLTLALFFLFRYTLINDNGRHLGMGVAWVRVTSRSISPRWGPIRFRPAPRTCAPWGVRVVSLAKSSKIPTRSRKILPLFFVGRTCWGGTRRRAGT